MSNKAIWVRPSRGDFYFATDKDRLNPFNTFRGTIEGINFKDDEFKGKKFRSVYVSFNTVQGKVVMSLRCDATYVQRFLGFLCNSNIEEEVEVSISEDKVGDYISSAMFVSQGGVFLKSIFTLGSEYELPKWEEIEFRGEKLFDKSKAIERMEEIVKELVASKINSTSNNSVEMPEYIPQETTPQEIVPSFDTGTSEEETGEIPDDFIL